MARRLPEPSNDQSRSSNRNAASKSSAIIRRLTETEIQRREGALGKPIERNYLVHWVSLSIRGVVELSSLPSTRQLRNDLTRMAREGRQWIRHVADYPDIFSPRARAERDRLMETAEAFCQSIDVLAAQAASSIKAGQRKTHPAFEAFLDNLIGIAKKEWITPSTPQRRRRITKKRIIKGHIKKSAVKQPPPPFYQFVLEALTISLEVINASPLSNPQKSAARSIFPKTEEALIKAIENRRGRVRDYKEGTSGLTEWEG
jgi:hypothetical protein